MGELLYAPEGRPFSGMSHNRGTRSGRPGSAIPTLPISKIGYGGEHTSRVHGATKIPEGMSVLAYDSKYFRGPQNDCFSLPTWRRSRLLTLRLPGLDGPSGC